LRAPGRFAHVFADSFGELGSGNEGYYIATAFDEIHLQPVGLVGLTGAMAEVPFGRKLLDTLGVGLSVNKREQYKTALDSFTETGLTPANREMLDSILDAYQDQLVDGIARGRKLSGEQVRALIDGGPYTDSEALNAKLVDRLDYWDDMADEAAAAGRLVGLAAYDADVAGHSPDGAVPVALVRASGMIQAGGGLGGGIRAERLAGAIAEATRSPSIKAILMRIDSPGGSAVASETIAHAVRQAVDKGKPVIVSMGNMAGSGGYWIAMDATRIVAQPATLTGSIGVIAGKPVLAGLWDKLGIEWAELPRGQNADIWSMNLDYDEQGRARVESILDSLYGSFKAGVARGRGLEPDRVEAIAKGRVWTGAQAKDLGLVDALGGLFEAEQAVRDALHLPAGAALDLRPFPAPANPIAEALGFVRDRLGVLGGIGRLIGMIGAGGTATMPRLGLD
jgi:protease-4